MFRVLKRGGLCSITISDIDQCNFKQLEENLYEEQDPAFPKIRFRKVADQTFEKLEGKEAGIPHYCFSKEELEQTLAAVGFTILDSRRIRWNIVINAEK